MTFGTTLVDNTAARSDCGRGGWKSRGHVWTVKPLHAKIGFWVFWPCWWGWVSHYHYLFRLELPTFDSYKSWRFFLLHHLPIRCTVHTFSSSLSTIVCSRDGQRARAYVWPLTFICYRSHSNWSSGWFSFLARYIPPKAHQPQWHEAVVDRMTYFVSDVLTFLSTPFSI